MVDKTLLFDGGSVSKTDLYVNEILATKCGIRNMPVGDFLEYVATQPLPKLDHAFLMTGWAEMPAFAGEGQQVFMAAVFAAPIRSGTSFTRAKPLCRSP